jgi:riboflavin biosynthesis pyrimidine reductase
MVGVRSLWPTTADAVSDEDLERIYAYPEELAGPWVQVNFVCSADGAMRVGDRSGGLSGPADKRVYQLGRDLADVVLVGAGTVRTEGYRGARTGVDRLARRRRLGRSDVPPIAVVTRTGDIDPGSALFTDTRVPPIVLTAEAAPEHRRATLTAAGAELVICGTDQVDLPAALDHLAERGLRRINCEGGPHLFAQLIAVDLVDQLCLTMAPLLAGAGADRIVAGTPADAPRHMDLASILYEDGFVMLRYRRSHPPTQPPAYRG